MTRAMRIAGTAILAFWFATIFVPGCNVGADSASYGEAISWLVMFVVGGGLVIGASVLDQRKRGNNSNRKSPPAP